MSRLNSNTFQFHYITLWLRPTGSPRHDDYRSCDQRQLRLRTSKVHRQQDAGLSMPLPLPGVPQDCWQSLCHLGWTEGRLTDVVNAAGFLEQQQDSDAKLLLELWLQHEHAISLPTQPYQRYSRLHRPELSTLTEAYRSHIFVRESGMV